MNIQRECEGSILILRLSGRLDTNTAPMLQKEIDQIKPEQNILVINMAKLDYVSSAGLRVLLLAQKKMQQYGSMKITNANEGILEVFEITGFADIVTIE